MGRLGRRRRTRNRKPVAARHEQDAELPLDAIEVLIALAVKQWEQQVVVKLQLRARLPDLAGGDVGRDRCHARAAPPSAADRLLALAPVIQAGMISPMWSAVAMTCTLCR